MLLPAQVRENGDFGGTPDNNNYHGVALDVGLSSFTNDIKRSSKSISD